MQEITEFPEDFLSSNGYVNYAEDKFYKRMNLCSDKEGVIIEVERFSCLDTIGAMQLLALTPDRSVWHYEVKTIFVRQYAPDFHISYKLKDIREITILEQELKTLYNLFCQQDNNFKKD